LYELHRAETHLIIGVGRFLAVVISFRIGDLADNREYLGMMGFGVRKEWLRRGQWTRLYPSYPAAIKLSGLPGVPNRSLAHGNAAVCLELL